MQAGFLGTTFDWTDVLIVAAWGAAGLLFALRRFTWEPARLTSGHPRQENRSSAARTLQGDRCDSCG